MHKLLQNFGLIQKTILNGTKVLLNHFQFIEF